MSVKNYLGIDVFEGAYQYQGLQLVPTWGGDMFEELMPDLFVPEAAWGKKSFGRNHPLPVKAQIRHGMDDAKYGYWGFSPASDPAGGYREYGVDAIGLAGSRATHRTSERTRSSRVGRPGLPARRSARADVRRRCGDPARVVPRAALRPGRRAGQPREAAQATSTPTARVASTTR